MTVKNGADTSAPVTRSGDDPPVRFKFSRKMAAIDSKDVFRSA